MNNVYHRDIMEILLACGSNGMRLCRLARRIYNRHATLFDSSINYEDIHKSISTYLWKQSQRKESPFCHNSYGIYAIKSDMAIQLDLFWDIPKNEIKSKVEVKKDAPKHIQLELF